MQPIDNNNQTLDYQTLDGANTIIIEQKLTNMNIESNQTLDSNNNNNDGDGDNNLESDFQQNLVIPDLQENIGSNGSNIDSISHPPDFNNYNNNSGNIDNQSPISSSPPILPHSNSYSNLNNNTSTLHHRSSSTSNNTNSPPISISPSTILTTSNGSISTSTSSSSLSLNNNNNKLIQQKAERAERLAKFREKLLTSNFLELLNIELVNYIFLNVGALAMSNLIQVSKQCFRIGMNEKLWLIFVQNDFKQVSEIHELNQLKKLNGSMRSLYANLYFKKKNSLPPPTSPNPLVKYFLRPISKIPGLFQRKEYKILMYGLAGSGKTATLYKFTRGENVKTSHTNGYNVEVVEYKSCDFICWDIGFDGDSLVPVWHHYLQDTQAIIFLIDSCDRSVMPYVKDQLWKLVTDKNVIKIINNFKNNNNSNNNNNNNSSSSSRIKVLIYANKIDQANPMTTLEITLLLSLINLPKNISWHVQGCSATSEEGDGLYEGLDWLSSQLDT